METLLLSLKAAVKEAQASLDKEDQEDNRNHESRNISSMYRITLSSVTHNWNKVTALWQWLPKFTSSVQGDIAQTLRKIFPLVTGLGDALPASLQVHIKRFLISLPSKWAALSYRFASWTMTTALFNPKSSLEQLDLLTDLVLDTKCVLRNIKLIVLQHLEKSGVPTLIFSNPYQSSSQARDDDTGSITDETQVMRGSTEDTKETFQ